VLKAIAQGRQFGHRDHFGRHVASEVIAVPELAALRYRFQHDLEEGLLMLLRGLPTE